MIRFIFLIMWAACAVCAVAAEPVFMGYRSLNAEGQPQDIRVALTRGQLTQLWKRIHAEAQPADPSADLATGPGNWTLSLSPDHASIEAELHWPVAVFTQAWQQVRLPLHGATVRAIRSAELGATQPGKVVWSVENNTLVVSLAGTSQATIIINLSISVHENGDEQSAILPLPGLGGSLQLPVIPDWEWRVDDLVLPVPRSPEDHETTTSLPLRDQARLSLRRRDGRLPDILQASLHQDVRLTLQDDRIEWSADILADLRGASVRSLTFSIPSGLSITTVEGAGLADWSTTATQVQVNWSSPVSGDNTLHLHGVLARPQAAQAITLQLPDARRSDGRVAILRAESNNTRAERLSFQDDPGLSRDEPSALEDSAVVWHAAQTPVAVRIQAIPTELRSRIRAAIVLNHTTLQIQAEISLSGQGQVDVLDLVIPEPWRSVATLTDEDDEVADMTFWRIEHGENEANGQRHFIIRRPGGFVADTTIKVGFSCERLTLGDAFQLPDLRPVGLTVSEAMWAIGDIGIAQLRLSNNSFANTDAARITQKLGCPDGVTWRGTWDGRKGARAQLHIDESPLRTQASVSHYVVLEAGRLQVSVHCLIHTESGALNQVIAQLPAGARLIRAQFPNYGSLVVDENGRLIATFATPVHGDIALNLDLEFPLTDTGEVTMHNIRLEGIVLGTQQVVLVEDDGYGIIRRQFTGLEPLDTLVLPLPTGVDATQVRWRWLAQSASWNLTLRREALALTGGLDGIATLVDIQSAVAPDGELRSRGTWHVLNRSRQHLRLDLPPGLDLWETRVDGRTVSCRRDGDQVIWIPVRPLRAGEAARRIILTWRQDSDGKMPRLIPRSPNFPELRIVQTVWRVIPPPGWSLDRVSGSLREATIGEAEQDRTDRVVEELNRLRGQTDLKDRALIRCNGNLKALELELHDYASQAEAQGSREQSVSINSAIGALQKDYASNDMVFGNRSSGRKKLAIGSSTRSWVPSQSELSSTLILIPAMPWEAALTLAGDGRLGDGEAPAGPRGQLDRALLGIDLLGDTAGGLVLRGSGIGDVILSLSPPRARSWPWLAMISAVLVGCVALWSSKRT